MKRLIVAVFLFTTVSFGQIGFTSSGGISTETVQTLISDSLAAKFPYNVYRAALSQNGDGTPTVNSGDLVVGQRYEITTLKGAGTTPAITAAGSGYTTSSPVSTTGGNGTGLTVSITADLGMRTETN